MFELSLPAGACSKFSSMRTNGGLLLRALVCAILVGLSTQAYAQRVYGSLNGNVSDSSGAAVREAQVTVTESSKGVSVKTKTNGAGLFVEGQLVPGTYVVSVEAPNFGKVISEPLIVQVDTVTRFDVKLTLGKTSETVFVSSAAPLMQTDKADVATTFNSNEILALPDYDRNLLSLEFLVPGVTLPAGDSTAVTENPQGSFRARINGRVFGATGYRIDGTDDQDAWLGLAVINPNSDSVAEVKVSTQNYDAENGYVSGGLLEFTTKSGSNGLHGSIFEYLVNNSPGFRTVGSDPFTQPNGAPPVKSNQFGGSLGGPILHDKLFFFGDAQIQRLRNDDNVLTTVPTQKVRDSCLPGIGTCDLSEYLANNGQVYSPKSGDYLSAAPAGKGRTPFLNNQIPSALISQPAINILKYYPAPNVVPSNGQPTQNNYLGAVAEVFNAQQYDARTDYYLNNNNTFFGRYTIANFFITAPGGFGSLAGGPTPASVNFAGTSSTTNQNLSLGYTRTINSKAVNEFRYGFYRYNVHVTPGGFGTQPAAQAGIPGLNLDSTLTSGFPAFSIGGISSIGYSNGINKCNCSLTETENENELVDTFSKSLRNHFLKFGADLRHTSNLRAPSDSHRAGELTSAAGYTALNGSSGGLGLASFLLGEVTTFTRFVGVATNPTAYLDRVHFFGQDTWHITPKLTLNYGLRWELTLPEATDPGKGGLFDVNTGLVNVFGVGGNSSRGFQQTAYKNFAPRFAVAYSITPKTVVRAGYGWSYDTGDGGIIFNEANISYPALIQQSNTPANASQGVFALTAGPPTINPPVPNGAGEVPLPAGVTGITRPVYESLTAAYTYNAAIEREVSKYMSLTAAYVGSSARHAENDRNNNVDINQAPFIPGQLALATNKPFYARFGLTQSINDFCNCASEQYNAFQATVKVRSLHGYTTTGNYLYQRSYGDGTTSYTFLYDRPAGRGDNNSIYHSQLILTQFYDLPFGTGKLIDPHAGHIVDGFIGGWSLSGVTILHSGNPFTATIGSYPTGYLGQNTVGVNFPDRGAGSPYQGAAHNRTQWFQGCTVAALQANTCSGFALPSQNAFGNFGINNLFGPSYVDQDVAVQKRLVKLADRYDLLLRAEAFNVFNHPNLNTPNANITSTTAGQITSTAGNLRRLQFAARLTF